MKSIILPAALLCSFAALAQAPVASVKHVYKYAANDRKQAAKVDQEDDDCEVDKAGSPANHGQTVQVVASGTPLTGTDKGAAMSTLGSSYAATRREHSQGARSEHSARGNGKNTHRCGQQSGGHYGGH